MSTPIGSTATKYRTDTSPMFAGARSSSPKSVLETPTPDLRGLVPLTNPQDLVQQITKQYVHLKCPRKMPFSLVQDTEHNLYLNSNKTNPVSTHSLLTDTDHDETLAMALQALEIAQHRFDRTKKSSKTKPDQQNFFNEQIDKIYKNIRHDENNRAVLGKKDCALIQKQYKPIKPVPAAPAKTAPATRYFGLPNLGSTCYLNSAFTALAGFGQPIINAIDQQIITNASQRAFNGQQVGVRTQLLSILKHCLNYILDFEHLHDSQPQEHVETFVACFNGLDLLEARQNQLSTTQQMDAMNDVISPILAHLLPNFVSHRIIKLAENDSVTPGGVKAHKEKEKVLQSLLDVTALHHKHSAQDRLSIILDRAFLSASGDPRNADQLRYECLVKLPENGVVQVGGQNYKIASLVLHRASGRRNTQGHLFESGGHYVTYIPDPQAQHLSRGTLVNDSQTTSYSPESSLYDIQSLGREVTGIMLEKIQK